MNKTAPYLLLKASRLLKASLKSGSNTQNIRSVPFHLLAILNDKPATVLEIAEKLSCSKQEASRLIKATEENSLIVITPSDMDKRVKNISLSRNGKNLLKGGSGLYSKTDDEIKRLLGNDDYLKFKASLKKICEALE
jgi:DNA-binding MarR family transcriptional regulator